MVSVLWFRRDLRLADNPALLAAVADARADDDRRVVPLFVVDPVLWDAAGAPRRAYLVASLQALDEALQGELLVLGGDPARVLPHVVRSAGAGRVHVAADFGPYGRRRDDAVADALDVPLVRTGSPYAVAPGRLLTADTRPYRVFTPYYRAWLAHGWRAPAASATDVRWWRPTAGDGLPSASAPAGMVLPAAGEDAARDAWATFREAAAASYASDRDRPDRPGTSRLSHHLRFGEIHPRTVLAGLGPDDDAFRRELAWREFYADVLAVRPDSARASLDRRFDEAMPWASGPSADAAFAAWASGRTGYPLVDAGMRQLRADGWMHNRVRMVVASFLVKDLHLPWQRGAREFMRLLCDGDLASNAHGWQWTAGCGTDAAPFFRVFNPVRQGLTFDPAGDYVRRYVPELRHVAGAAAHEPWRQPDGYAHGYPARIVDHAAERAVALADHRAAGG